MATPEQTPDTELEVQELTDENLDEVSGGIRVRPSYDLAAAGVDGAAAAAAEPQNATWGIT
jgi:hypothetical protein